MTLNLENYTIDEVDGDLVVLDTNDNTVLTWDDTNGKWMLGSNAPLDISELIDGAGVSHTGALLDQGGPLTTALDANNNDIDNVGALTTETLGSERHYAGAYDGADADTRLDNALSVASKGEVIYLENETYSASRTFSERLAIIGCAYRDGTIINSGTWTLDNQLFVTNIMQNGGDISITNVASQISNIYALSGTITVSNDDNLITGCYNADVTFESGTSDNVIDACMRSSATDNGTNTVGDIA